MTSVSDKGLQATSTSKSATDQEARRAAKEVECGEEVWEVVGSEDVDEDWENITAEEANDAK